MKTMIALPQNSNVTSAHQQVTLALNPRLMQPALRPFVNQMIGPKGMRRSRKDVCHILDAKYEPGKRCSILYEVRKKMFIGELTWPADERRTAGASDLPPAMQLYPFERDPGLPALTTAINGDAMQRILNKKLPDCLSGGQHILRCQVTLLRYRLGKRCTLRYDLRLRDINSGTLSTRTLFGKLYHSAAKAANVYREMQMLAETQPPPLSTNLTDRDSQHEESATLNKLVVARAMAYIPSLPMVLQSPVADSAPLELLLQQPPSAHQSQLAQVSEGIQGAAAVLAELHQSTVRSSRIRSVDAELEKLQRRSGRFANVDATTGADMHQLARELLARRAQLQDWGEQITVVHGDCKPSQFFLLPDGEMALLDFDHCGMADPAADVGNFLATLRQMGTKQVLKQQDPDVIVAWQRWLDTLENVFLDAYLASYPCHVGFRRRATWYQAMALLRKALRSFARSTRSPLPSLLIQEAWQVLEECKKA